jgi:iron complex transport system substrate-binding protein
MSLPVLLAVTLALPASAVTQSPPVFPRTIAAGMGRSLTLSGPPRRIVSLMIPVDEILSVLADKSRIQAVTYLAVEPSISNVLAWAQGIPHKIQMDIEQTLACEPDLVFVSKSTRAEIVKLLLDMGVPVVAIEFQNSIKNIKDNILKIGEALGEEARASRTVAEMDRKLDEVALKIRAVKRRPRVMAYHQNGTTSGKDRTADELIVLGGGINIATEKGVVGSRKISEEQLIDWNPEVILLSGYAPTKETFPDELRANPALQTVDAIKNNRVYVIHGKYFTTTSHFIANGVEEVAHALHPEIFMAVAVR